MPRALPDALPGDVYKRQVHNKDFSDGLNLYDRYFLGPVKMPLSLLTRCCGPEENMKWRINEEWFEKHVNELSEVLKKETDMPPLIVHYLSLIHI